MSDTTIADKIVAAKSATVITENLKVALATGGGGSITPSTVTAMIGIQSGSALQLAPNVTAAMTALSTKAASLDYPANVQAASALSNLTSLQSKILPSGNHGAFGSFLSQAQSHIGDSIELTKATNFMSTTSFSDLGSGITNMSSMTTQGLNGSLGSLTSAAAAMTAAGPVFDTTNMSTFGTGAGLVSKLNSAKLANETGLNAALAQNGVDTKRLTDPVYADSINATLSSIKDPATIASVNSTLGINPPGQINSLADLTDINKLAKPSDISGLTGGLTGMGTKFADLGASFKTPDAATNMLTSLKVPSTPTLDAAAPDLASFMGGQKSSIAAMTGVGVGTSPLTGPLGVPSITDFTHAVSGGPEIDALAGGKIDVSSIQALSDATTKSTNLFSTAGIDLTSPPPAGLSTSMNFATSLHKFGADTSGSGISDVLGNMAVPGSQAGDAIKASLAEGKNKALMALNGIKPLNFSGS